MTKLSRHAGAPGAESVEGERPTRGGGNRQDTGSTVLSGALSAIERSWFVFPVHGKKPLFTGWQDAATIDETTVRQWFASDSGLGYGISCGPSGLAVVDVDDADKFKEWLNGRELPDTFTVATNRGHHYYFAQPGGEPIRNFVDKYKTRGFDVRVDGGFIVGPGSPHTNGGQYRVVDTRQPVPLPLWLAEALDRSRKTGDGATGERFVLPEKIPVGARDDTMYRYACSLRARGTPVTKAIRLMREAYDRCEQPSGDPFTLDEALAKVDSAWASYDGPTLFEFDLDGISGVNHADNGSVASEVDGAEGVRERFPLLDIKALVDPDRPKRRWLLDGIVPVGDHVSVVAPGGTGKSLLLLALAVSAATEEETFAGRALDLSDGRVFYMDMENSEDDWSERLIDLGVTPGSADDLLRRFFPFAMPALRGLDTPQGARQLMALLDAYEATAGDVLVLDSTQRVTEGEENSNDTIRRLYQYTSTALKRRGITVIRSDNTGWDSSRERGASGKRDDVAYCWLLTEDDREPGVFTLRNAKHRGRGTVNGVLTMRRQTVGGVLRFVAAKSPYGAKVAAARELLDELGVPTDAPQRTAWDAVRAAKDAAVKQGDPDEVARFDGLGKTLVQKVQGERGRTIEIVGDDHADD